MKRVKQFMQKSFSKRQIIEKLLEKMDRETFRELMFELSKDVMRYCYTKMMSVKSGSKAQEYERLLGKVKHGYDRAVEELYAPENEK